MDSHRSQPHGISSPPSFTGFSSTSAPSTVGQSLGSDHHHARAVTEPVYSIHTYNLKEYASVSINGHSSSTQGEPLLYLGEEITGSVVFPAYRLHEVRSIVVALRAFIYDPADPSYKTKVVLLSEHMNDSYISNNEFCGQFAIAPPSASDLAPSPLTPSDPARSAAWRPSFGNLKFQLKVTIHRRGLFTQKIRIKLPIRCMKRPDPSLLFPVPFSSTREPPLSWTEKRCPEVIIRGDLFQHIRVEVACNLIIPTSYPVSDEIPLCLFMTCENRVAIDLFGVSHALDVRLLKVLIFGKDAASATPPFTIVDRKSYHITEWVAKAQWEVDGQIKELPPSDQHPNRRWHVKLNGKLLRDPSAEITHSFAEPGIAHMYYVCIFPFSSTNFSPISKPDKALFYGKMSITK